MGGFATVENPSWTLAHLVEACKGELRYGESSAAFRSVSTDSRTIRPGDIFLALKGDNFDGANFIHEAIKNGASCVISEKVTDKKIPAPLIVVPNSLMALGELARYRRNLLKDLKVISITGSSGKTTVKEMLGAISGGRISEGHARPLMMLTDRPEEQVTLYKEIMLKKITVREAESIARKIAFEKMRKNNLEPELLDLEDKLTEAIGTRVQIKKKEVGGRLTIDFFSENDLQNLLYVVEKSGMNHSIMGEELRKAEAGMFDRPTVIGNTVAQISEPVAVDEDVPAEPGEPASIVENAVDDEIGVMPQGSDNDLYKTDTEIPHEPSVEGESAETKKDSDDDLYSVRNFSI